VREDKVNKQKIKNLVNECIKTSLEMMRNGYDIYQESDWKCFLYYLIKKELEPKYNKDFVLHTELRVKGYLKRQKCDLVILNRPPNYYIRYNNQKTEAVTPIIAIELKMHGGKSKKWDNTSFMEKVEEFKKDYKRLLKCGADFTYCLFVDWEVINKESIIKREDFFKERFLSKESIISKYCHIDRNK